MKAQAHNFTCSLGKAGQKTQAWGPPSLLQGPPSTPEEPSCSLHPAVSLLTPPRQAGRGPPNNWWFRSHFVKNNGTHVFKIDFKHMINCPVQHIHQTACIWVPDPKVCNVFPPTEWNSLTLTSHTALTSPPSWSPDAEKHSGNIFLKAKKRTE